MLSYYTFENNPIPMRWFITQHNQSIHSIVWLNTRFSLIFATQFDLFAGFQSDSHTKEAAPLRRLIKMSRISAKIQTNPQRDEFLSQHVRTFTRLRNFNNKIGSFFTN